MFECPVKLSENQNINLKALPDACGITISPSGLHDLWMEL